MTWTSCHTPLSTITITDSASNSSETYSNITLTFVTLPHSLALGRLKKILDPPLHNKGILLIDVFISVAAVEKHDELKTQSAKMTKGFSFL